MWIAPSFDFVDGGCDQYAGLIDKGGAHGAGADVNSDVIFCVLVHGGLRVDDRSM